MPVKSLNGMNTTLKKSLTTFQLTLYGIGTIIGAGIYALIGKVAGASGTMAPFSFIISAIIALFSALSYAALSSKIPKSGGEAIYVLKAFKLPFLAKIVGYLVLFTGIITSATLLKGFSGYLNQIIAVPEPLAIGIILTFLVLICIIGIQQSIWFVGIITIIEILGLFFVMYLASDSFGVVDIQVKDFLPSFTVTDYVSCFSGAFLAFFAYIGFEDLANVAEEAKTPKKSLPFAILFSMIVCTLLYILVAVFCVMSIPIDELSASSAPLAEIALKKGENYSTIISVVSMIALLNGAFVQIIMGSRLMYGMAEKQLFPSFFHVLSKKFRTPTRSVLLVSFIIYLLAIALPLVRLAESSSFIVLIVFMLVNLALFRFSRDKDYNFPKIYSLLSIIGFGLCFFMVTFKVVMIWVN